LIWSAGQRRDGSSASAHSCGKLVALPCDVIIRQDRMTEEALRITSTIPIVFDQLGSSRLRIVTSLVGHGRNITGVMEAGPEVGRQEAGVSGRPFRRLGAWRCWPIPLLERPGGGPSERRQAG
jgi:hypothetical protein